ncbi:MAG: hypothetical protein CVV44_01425 [Spirochaetae bacterium HGW-Spirochaetae-1]|jgi:nitroreductase/NAD-dependent dihydropyrimidine dehydrogenase PreA subunit|nr:MAG: hypothetical protein CVV44_01425 [Spirochaetae bacterium HGW-Spirochaetae-1]
MKLLPEINHKKCILCKKCVSICPKDILAIDDNRIVTNAEECMLCSHCYDICPADAISFDPSALRKPEFKGLSYREQVKEKKDIQAGELINIIRSRRSVRKYREREVSDSVIDDLISFAVTAPSGSNCQNWEFAVINGREKVWGLAREIKTFFEKINRLVENPFLRYGTIPFIGTKLLRYYNRNYASVKMAMAEAERGNDRLFHGAPTVIIIHGSLEGSTPLEDAQYASYNMTILAHALGLGTCYIGYAVESINRAPGIKKSMGIPGKNRILAVLTLGYPAVTFKKHSLRKPWSVVKI